MHGMSTNDLASPNSNEAAFVKLLIKASNQQFDDHTLECDLQWSVRRLKTQLSQVYPSKPAVSEQKLIYSGQLLNDTLLLKDVIRSYKDVQTQHHIFHLVCASRHLPQKIAKSAAAMAINASNEAAPTTLLSTDGLRYRNNAVDNTAVTAGVTAPQLATLQQQQQQQQQQEQQNSTSANTQFIPSLVNGVSVAANCPNFNPNNMQTMAPFGLGGQLNMQSLATQQAAMYNWMHQVYSQYMDQCLRLSSNIAAGLPAMPSADATSSPPSTATAAAPFAANPFLQNMPFMSNAVPAANLAAFAAPGTVYPALLPFQSSAAAAAVVPETVAIAAPTATGASMPQAAAANAAAAVGAGAGAAAVADQRPPQLQRFANLAQDDQENQDWLESFFSLTRLVFFLMILFFNTSPLRCFLVLLIGGGIYLYHIGVLRFRVERINNQNANHGNDNAAAAAADAINQIRQGVQEVQQAQQQQQQQQEQPAEIAARDAAAPLPAAAATVEATAASSSTATERNRNVSEAISFVRTFVVGFFTSLLPEMSAQ